MVGMVRVKRVVRMGRMVGVKRVVRVVEMSRGVCGEELVASQGVETVHVCFQTPFTKCMTTRYMFLPGVSDFDRTP